MTKTELTDALNSAHGALAYAISRTNRDIRRARRALRSHPHLEYYRTMLALAVATHLETKNEAKAWLSTSSLRVVRAKAAKMIRRDLISARKHHPRAFPARPVLALAA